MADGQDWRDPEIFGYVWESRDTNLRIRLVQLGLQLFEEMGLDSSHIYFDPVYGSPPELSGLQALASAMIPEDKVYSLSLTLIDAHEFVAAIPKEDSHSELIKGGIERARSEGKSIGRPPKLNPAQVAICRHMRQQGSSIREISRSMDCAPNTVRRAINRRDLEA